MAIYNMIDVHSDELLPHHTITDHEIKGKKRLVKKLLKQLMDFQNYPVSGKRARYLNDRLIGIGINSTYDDKARFCNSRKYTMEMVYDGYDYKSYYHRYYYDRNMKQKKLLQLKELGHIQFWRLKDAWQFYRGGEYGFWATFKKVQDFSSIFLEYRGSTCDLDLDRSSRGHIRGIPFLLKNGRREP